MAVLESKSTAVPVLYILTACLTTLMILGTTPATFAETARTAAAVDPLDTLVEQAITTTSQRFLNAEVHTPWQIVHGLLALRLDYQLKYRNQRVNAIDWISDGATFRGAPWFEVTEHGGRAHPFNGTPYEFEGHVNQTLAVLSMCQLPLTHEFRTPDGQVITMQQMVDHAKMNVSSHVEITWTLWFLTQYVDQDEEWMNKDDEPWSMERLVRMQVKDSPYDSPCGGTHGMFALAYARNAYYLKHGELRGAWLEADQKLQRYLVASQRMQNRDGSFATNWFKSTGHSTEFNERLKYSGHMLEWIVVALPKSRLKEQWIRAAVQSLCYDLIRNSRAPADCGPLYHALHSLVLYREQMSPKSTPSTEPLVTKSMDEDEVGPVTQETEISDEAVPTIQPKTPPVKIASPPAEALETPNGRRTSATGSQSESPNKTDKRIHELMPILKTAATDEVADLDRALQEESADDSAYLPDETQPLE